jgi:hypothetical protein
MKAQNIDRDVSVESQLLKNPLILIGLAQKRFGEITTTHSIDAPLFLLH